MEPSVLPYLYTVEQVALSPRGDLAAVVVRGVGGGWAVWLVGVEDGVPIGYAEGCWEACWSRDGLLALACQGEDGGSRVYLWLPRGGRRLVYKSRGRVWGLGWVGSDLLGLVDDGKLVLVHVWSGWRWEVAAGVAVWAPAQRSDYVAYASGGVVYVARPGGGGYAATRIGEGYQVASIAWSPDDSMLLVHATACGGLVSTAYTVPREGGEPEKLLSGPLSPVIDLVYTVRRCRCEPRWVRGNNIVYCLAARGFVGLYRVQPRGEPEELVAGKLVVHCFSVDETGSRIIYAISRPNEPDEVWAYDIGSGRWRVTRLASWTKWLRLQEPEHQPEPVDTWYLPPKHLEPGRRRPLALLVHDNPGLMTGYSFNPLAQLLSANGVNVVYTEYPGSQGYMDPSPLTATYQQALDTLHYILERETRKATVDPDRLAVIASGYGCLLALDLAARRRITCMVLVDPVANLELETRIASGGNRERAIHALSHGYPATPHGEPRIGQALIAYTGSRGYNRVHVTLLERFLKARGTDTIVYEEEDHQKLMRTITSWVTERLGLLRVRLTRI